MRLSVLLLALSLALPAHAQEDPIQAVIESQIKALQVDDFDLAFSFASPNIKALFGTPETFGRMVKDGYPMVYRPSDVDMQELREIAGNLWQRVRVVDRSRHRRAGRSTRCRYCQRLKSGSDGCHSVFKGLTFARSHHIGLLADAGAVARHPLAPCAGLRSG